jgi:formate/nitrite transporter FocA (FNT family)
MNEEVNNIREQREKTVSQLLRYFSTIMAVLYMAIGILFYFYLDLQNLGETGKLVICIGLFTYGVIRLIRIIKR